MTKLSEANIDLLMLEEDIMPNLLKFQPRRVAQYLPIEPLIEPLRGFGRGKKKITIFEPLLNEKRT